MEICSQRATWLSASPGHPPHPPRTNRLRSAQSNQNSTNCILICIYTDQSETSVSCFCNTLLGNFLLIDVSKMVGGQGEKERPLKSLAGGQCPLQPGSGSEELKWDPGRGGHLTFPICVMGVNMSTQPSSVEVASCPGTDILMT